MAAVIGTTSDLAEHQLTFWANQGVLRRDDNVFRLNGDMQSTASSMSNRKLKNNNTSALVDVSAQSVIPTGEERREEEMLVFATFITGMLTNLGALSADRIQTMLTMFVQQPVKYDRSQDELERFLNTLVRDDKLECNGGVYKLKK
jgi:anaphase-promoting complex subunit 2